MQNSNSVDSVLAQIEAQENTPVIIAKVKKSKIIKAPKAKTIPATPVTEISAPVIQETATPIAEETPKVKLSRPKLDPTTITPPANVKVEIKKSFTKIYNDTKKSALKGTLLEFSVVVENLDPRLHILTAEEIKNGHLGTMKAILKGIKDDADLQTIINNYFA